MDPGSLIIWANLIMTVGSKFAMEWAGFIAKAREGKPITLEELSAATKAIEYRAIVTNTFLPPAPPNPLLP